MIQNIKYKWQGDKKLKKEFEQILFLNPRLFSDFSFTKPVPYGYVKSIVEGKNKDLVRTLASSMAQNNLNLKQYIADEPRGKKGKGTPRQRRFYNFNSFTQFHEDGILDEVKKEAKGNFAKYIDGLNKMLHYLQARDFAFNVVFYADYDLG